jgi:hypothetical protein
LTVLVMPFYVIDAGYHARVSVYSRA